MEQEALRILRQLGFTIREARQAIAQIANPASAEDLVCRALEILKPVLA